MTKRLTYVPTGKAAYLIIHSVFHISASHGYAYKSLTADKLNNLRVKFKDVKLIIIDEISMVGCSMWIYINRRLQHIVGNQQPFGGIHIIAVGDLFQLKPVMDSWKFKNPSKDYIPLAINLWQEHMTMFELDEIMRQKGREFAELLNRLREGNQANDDINLLKTRKRCTLH